MPCHGTPSLALIPLELFVWIKAFVWYVLRSDINGIRSCSKEFGGGVWRWEVKRSMRQQHPINVLMVQCQYLLYGLLQFCNKFVPKFGNTSLDLSLIRNVSKITVHSGLYP